MTSRIWHWYARDSALHSYVLINFITTLPFAVFGTYSFYQLQLTGFLVGTDGNGGPCTTYCMIPWAGSQLDVNSVLLYLNAFGFGIGGALALILCAYADFWSSKHLLVTFFMICFGAVTAPVYWLQDFTESNFNALSSVYILFAFVTIILVALLNIYIPYLMRTKAHGVIEAVDNATEPIKEQPGPKEGERRKYGFEMSSFGGIANGLGGILMFIIVIILTQTLPTEESQSSGLLVTSVTGFVTIAGSVIAYLGLPAIPAKEHQEGQAGWYQPAVEFFRPLKDLLIHKNMAALLISYTIYIDTTFAVSSVTGQLFVLELQPSTLEITLYSLTNYLFLLASSAAFLYIRPHLKITLETWLNIGYALMVVVPVWGCIGLAPVSFGFKYKWEFYVQLLLTNISGALVNTAFRVLFSELVPARNEVRWFGMQLVLSCATVWVNYVASAPLQNATHQLRFPLVLSLVFLLLALAVEIARSHLSLFKDDRAMDYLK